jgi:PAS domain S-box-containing protein
MAQSSKKSEKEPSQAGLRYSAQWFSAIFDGSQDAIFISNIKGLFADVNKAAEKLTGYSKNELLKMAIPDLHDPQDLHAYQNYFERIIAGEEITSEALLRRKDSSHITTEFSNKRIVIGNDIFMHTVARDITERRKAEEELYLFSEIMTNMSEGIQLTRVRDAVIIYANPQFERMFNYNPGELVGKSVSVLNAPSDKMPEETTDEIIQSLKSNGAWKGEILNIRKEGTQFWCSVSVSELIKPDKTKVWISVHKDISSKKLAEENLKKNERLLSETQRNANIGSWDWNLKTGEAIWSDQLFHIYGRDPVLGVPKIESYLDNYHQDDWIPLQKAIKNAVENRIPFNIDFRIFRENDGAERWIRSQGELEKDEKGEPARFLGIAQDITDRKKMEDTLKEANFYNRSLIEASLDPLVTIGPDGKIMDVNIATQKITGCSRQELIGTDFSGYFTEPLKAKTGYQEVFSTGFVRDYALNIKNKSGKIVPVLYNASLYHDPEGNIKGVIAAARDISERTYAEEIIKKNEANLRSLIENNDGSIWSIDKKFNLIDCNLMFSENYFKGTGQILLKGSDVTVLLPAKLKKEWVRYYKRGLSGENFTINSSTSPPLEINFFKYSFNPIRDNKDEVTGLTVIGQNITDIKETEKKLEQSTRELRDLARHLDKIMEIERTMIAHNLHDDLGQKLTALNMDISWLKSRIGVQSRTVKNKIREMISLINETLESTRKISYGLRPSILDDLGIRSAIEWQLSELEKKSGINYSVSFPAGEITINNEVALALFRTVQEALTNVVRHSKATFVFLNVRKSKKHLSVSVADNGIGIKNEQITSSKSFGLIGIRERVKVFGGDVKIRNLKGNGTEMFIRIPLKVKSYPSPND